MRTKHKRAYKYRMYPTHDQERVLACTFGCARFVYNYFLRLRKQSYINEQQSLTYHDTSALLTTLKNHCLAKSISDVGWGEFVRQLECKARWYGRTFVKIDRWYPSSKQCFECGHVLDSLSLDGRSWTCPACGRFHDRDRNAAKNVLAEGLSVSACGEAVRPNTNGTVEGTPRRNMKPPS